MMWLSAGLFAQPWVTAAWFVWAPLCIPSMGSCRPDCNRIMRAFLSYSPIKRSVWVPSMAATLIGNVAAYWSDGSGFDFHLCHRIFLKRRIIPRYVRPGCFCVSVSFVMFCPVLSSEQAPALSWPQVRGAPPLVSVYPYFVIRNLQKPWHHGKMYKGN